MHIITQFLNIELQQDVFFFVSISTVVSLPPSGPSLRIWAESVELTYRKCDMKRAERKRGKLWICGRRIIGTEGSGGDGNISELGWRESEMFVGIQR